jgi:S-(hydroxymethyl)glutathione dehydrogenase/alcohol dehydrogenase
VLPEIVLAKLRKHAPFDRVSSIGCRVTTGAGAVLDTAQVGAGATAAVFGPGGLGLEVIEGMALAGADTIIGADINDARRARGERFGRPQVVDPCTIEGPVVAQGVGMTTTPCDRIGGADCSFDGTGTVTAMRDALACTHRGRGRSVTMGVAPADAVIGTRPFERVTGRARKGTVVGGGRGRTEVPTIVDRSMAGTTGIAPMIAGILPLDRISEGFDRMHRGKSIRSVVVFRTRTVPHPVLRTLGCTVRRG